MREDMIQITKEMVKIPSINTTEGERHIGEYIENFLRDIPYFKKHPEQVIVQELKNDKLHRRNVLAILLGEKEPNGKTLLFHTVRGISFQPMAPLIIVALIYFLITSVFSFALKKTEKRMARSTQRA